MRKFLSFLLLFCALYSCSSEQIEESSVRIEQEYHANQFNLLFHDYYKTFSINSTKNDFVKASKQYFVPTFTFTHEQTKSPNNTIPLSQEILGIIETSTPTEVVAKIANIRNGLEAAEQSSENSELIYKLSTLEAIFSELINKKEEINLLFHLSRMDSSSFTPLSQVEFDYLKLTTKSGVIPLSDGLYSFPGDSSKFLAVYGGRAYVQNCSPGLVFQPGPCVCDWPPVNTTNPRDWWTRWGKCITAQVTNGVLGGFTGSAAGPAGVAIGVIAGVLAAQATAC